MTETEVGLFWHVHHDTLFEWCYDADARRAYIKNNKPRDEIDTRIRLMKPVRGDLGDAKAWADYKKAYAEYDKDKAYGDAKARAKYDEALADYERAWAEYAKALGEYGKAWADHDTVRAKYLATIRPGEAEALHAIECPDCPWDGKTIFPKEPAR